MEPRCPWRRKKPAEISFAPASLTTLMDSPVITGAYFRDIDLSPTDNETSPTIHIAADGPAALEPSPAEVQHLRQLVAETGALFGARHYRRYDFLLALSDHMPPDGVEHHESSDNRTPEALFLDPDIREMHMDLLAARIHAFVERKISPPRGARHPELSGAYERRSALGLRRPDAILRSRFSPRALASGPRNASAKISPLPPPI